MSSDRTTRPPDSSSSRASTFRAVDIRFGAARSRSLQNLVNLGTRGLSADGILVSKDVLYLFITLRFNFISRTRAAPATRTPPARRRRTPRRSAPRGCRATSGGWRRAAGWSRAPRRRGPTPQRAATRRPGSIDR
eukprot:scaffold77481_cov64-Phaeocystis_antarctica.AAC.4